jgi:hypothetical protein
MSASLIPAVALGLRLFQGPAAVDWAYGAQAQAMAGSIPVSPDETFTPAAESFFELRTGMRVSSPGSSLSLRYTPRLFVRYPDTAEFGRPLLLHSVLLAAVTSPTPRWTLDSNATGSVGEVSYSSARQVFGTEASALRTSSVSVMMGTATVGSSHRTTRRNTLRLFASTGAQAPLYEGDPVISYETVGGGLSNEYRLTRVDTLTTSGGANYFLSDEQDPLLLGLVDVALQRRLDASSTLRFQAGAASTPEELPTVFPTGSVAYATGWGSGGQPWTFQTSGGAQVIFDPVTYDTRPIGLWSTDLATTFPSSLRAGVSLAAQASMTRDPNERSPFESSVHLALPCSYPLSERVELSFGARSSLQGPHWSELAHGQRQSQFLLYVGFRHHDGTAPSRGSWL